MQAPPQMHFSNPKKTCQIIDKQPNIRLQKERKMQFCLSASNNRKLTKPLFVKILEIKQISQEKNREGPRFQGSKVPMFPGSKVGFQCSYLTRFQGSKVPWHSGPKSGVRRTLNITLIFLVNMR